MRWLYLITVLSFTACGTPNEGGGMPGGSGGSGAAGGSGGEPNGVAPILELIEPADGSTADEPQVLVRARVSASSPIVKLGWLDKWGDNFEIPPSAETNFTFEFEPTLWEGQNRLQMFAVDDDGNESTLDFELTYENTPGRPARIESFFADPSFGEQGQRVQLQWRVVGTKPIQLQLHSTHGFPLDVTGARGTSIHIRRSDVEPFVLVATNEGGYDAAELKVGVGAELRLWPKDATIVPGARQMVLLENAGDADWTASGGEILPGYRSEVFTAEKPGTYTLTARTKEPVSRTVSTTITVREQASLVQGFQGLGGQLGSVNGWKSIGGIDAQGTLWLPVGDGFAVWRPADATWTFEADPAWERMNAVHRTQEGELFAITHTSILRLDADMSGWVPEASVPPGHWGKRYQLGPDGTLYILMTHWEDPGKLLALAPGQSSFEEIPLPLGSNPEVLAFDEAVGIILAAKVENQTRVFLTKGWSEPWEDTGPVPSPDEPIRDLLVDGASRVFLAGHTLALLGAEGWETAGSFPSCPPNELCGLFDLEVRSDGALLVLARSELWSEMPDGSFSVVGTPISEMGTRNSILGTLRTILEAPDGTLYVQGDLGVFTYSPSDETWSVVGAPGIMPTAETHDLLVDEDGGLLLASGGWLGQDGHFSLYERKPSESAWIGFGNEVLDVTQADPIGHIARDGAGNLIGLRAFRPAAFTIAAGTGKHADLPFDMRVAALQYDSTALGVSTDGTVFAADSEVVLRLAPGAKKWVEDSLPCAHSFARTTDGTLWAACGFPYRLQANGKWEQFTEGLPLSTYLYGEWLSHEDDGSLLFASPTLGTFRLEPGAKAWMRLGFGEPNLGASHIASRGGRTWTIADNSLFELSPETNSWIPVHTRLPINLWGASIFTAGPDGNLFLAPGGIGLLRSFDGR